MGNLEDVDEAALDAVLERLRSTGRVPVSTYRLQFNRHFTFRDASELVAYLDSLGITDCYASPYLTARPGSTHGYDVCDHGTLNPELGDERDFEAFVAELRKRQMGQILDVVPNHMSIWGASNARWMDVLENGPSSPHAAFFDVDWHPIRGDTDLENRVLLPVLGSSYGEVLENQELALGYHDGAFFIDYYEHRLPVDPSSYADILQSPAERLAERLEGGDERLLELQSIITALTYLPPYQVRDQESILERQREKEVVKRRLKDLSDRCQDVREAIDDAVRTFNGIRGEAQSFDHLDALLDRQPYRVADWRVAAEEINYRRFFDINDLAAIRTEDPVVFHEVHQLVFRLLREGGVTGLRIDHPDGLWDPAGYFRQLQTAYLLHLCESHLFEPDDCSEETRDGLRSLISRWMERELAAARETPPLYVVAEKILVGSEKLPGDWAVDGTTGYDFANAANGIFVDAGARGDFDRIYVGFVGRLPAFGELVNANKKMIMLSSMASEVNMLAYRLKRIAQRNRRYRDFTLNDITRAIRELIACLPIYRTYISYGYVDPRDRAYVEGAVGEAKRRNLRTHPSIFDFVRDTLLLRWPDNLPEEERLERSQFVCRFQQVTGPVMAKAMEDTSLYVYNRLISLNEVGGYPGQFGTTVQSFHQQNAERQRQWPHSLLATSTHDTKRSEDVRARIDVLSEMPDEWKAALTCWNRFNRHHKTMLDGHAVPDRNEEYYLYQTLLGAWPLGPMDEADHRSFVRRMQAHMLKAMKEAKVNTSWVNPNVRHEEAVQRFVATILDDSRANPFLEDFRGFQARIAHFGMCNSLSQTLLKIASPGVPDFYQGTELWDFSLVDPDNRRPVDYARRTHMLESLQRRAAGSKRRLVELARGLVRKWEDGRIKLYLIHRGLAYRKEHPDLFQEGDYIPIGGTGRRKEHICAFARMRGQQVVLVVVPRLVATLTRGARILPVGAEVWGDCCVTLPTSGSGQSYRNLFTGEVISPVPLGGQTDGLPLASVLANFPVALLEGTGNR